MKQFQHDCPDCQGTGFSKTTPLGTCETCDGTGRTEPSVGPQTSAHSFTEFDLPAACVFQLQQIALADDEMVKRPGAAEGYRFIARHILELFKRNAPADHVQSEPVSEKPDFDKMAEMETDSYYAERAYIKGCEKIWNDYVVPLQKKVEEAYTAGQNSVNP